MNRDSEPNHSPMSRHGSFANAAHLSSLMERKASLLESNPNPNPNPNPDPNPNPNPNPNPEP